MEETGRHAADAAAIGNAGATFGSAHAAPSSADVATLGNASVPFGSRGFQEIDQARAFQVAWEAGWKAGRDTGWQEGWDAGFKAGRNFPA